MKLGYMMTRLSFIKWLITGKAFLNCDYAQRFFGAVYKCNVICSSIFKKQKNKKMTREIIKNKIDETIEKINFYKAELEKLEKEDILFSDDQQWFVEKEEEVKFRQNRKLIKETRLIGRVYWKEHFVDEDTGETIEIERNCKVRENGLS